MTEARSAALMIEGLGAKLVRVAKEMRAELFELAENLAPDGSATYEFDREMRDEYSFRLDRMESLRCEMQELGWRLEFVFPPEAVTAGATLPPSPSETLHQHSEGSFDADDIPF